MSTLFLGVDGGQSSTTAVIGDESGRILGYGRGGPCNHVTGAEAKTRFVGAIGKAVGDALSASGSPVSQVPHFVSACLGFSGGADDKALWLDELFTSTHRTVTHDGLIALAGATGGQPGIIIIAGTGQFAFGRNASGRTARAGGWGYIYGDEGGGFDLARQAVRAALREEEGWGPKTQLTSMLLSASQARNANDLVHLLYTTEFPRPLVASWSHLVDDAAQNGDACAIEILRVGAQHLATYARAVHNNLFPTNDQDVTIAQIGGVFKSSILLEHFRKSVAPIPVIKPRYSPATGALIEAYREAGLAPTLSNVPEYEK